MMSNVRAKQSLRKVSATPESFYTRKYGGTQLAQSVTRGEVPWEKLPYLTRGEIQNTPFTDRLYKPLSEIDALRVTSGTSGAGIMIIPRLGYADVDDATSHHAYFTRYDIRSWATFSSAFFFSHIKWLKNHNLQSMQLDPSDMSFSARVVGLFRPDMLAGFPYALTVLAPMLPKQATDSIRAILLFGERASQLQRSFLKKTFPHAVLLEEYTSMEMQSPVGESCLDAAERGESRIHPIEEYAYVELINTDTGQPITEPNRTGEVVVTIVRDVAFPLIRYRTGDAAHFVEQSCGCDNAGTTLHIEGRLLVDRLRFAGGELQLAEVDRALGTIVEYCTGSDFEVRFSETAASDESVLPALTVVLSWDTQRIAADMLAARIADELHVAPNRTWADGVAAGALLPLTVARGSEDANPKKRVRIVRV